jgi:rhodanese-related sulfurtransferase
VKQVLFESAVVAVAGVILAFAANGLSPRGLELTRNYFPGATRPHLPAGAPANGTGTAGGTSTNSQWQALSARLQAKGLELIDAEQAERLFRDTRYEQNLVVFIDARDDQHYAEGHVPGAYQFFHYQAQDYVSAVLPACQGAEKVVVYCTGGDCEDSESAALMLRDDFKIPGSKVSVYGGGMNEWSAKRLPIETGARKSGKLREAAK